MNTCYHLWHYACDHVVIFLGIKKLIARINCSQTAEKQNS